MIANETMLKLIRLASLILMIFTVGCGTTKQVKSVTVHPPEDPKVRVPFIINPIIANAKFFNHYEKWLKNCKSNGVPALAKELRGLGNIKDLLETENDKFDNAEILTKAECLKVHPLRLQLKKDRSILSHAQMIIGQINDKSIDQEQLLNECNSTSENFEHQEIKFNRTQLAECENYQL